ncbi:hypothetical protein [Spirochaeta cellobiosiphila]|uniref:hypothetical protein n=1 Tax=Spirochaeta cellobiosiphila TaxID=504483 RepID=UPI0004299613|nr:hypothetical protein [Spirochaeta cellobiosiphila]
MKVIHLQNLDKKDIPLHYRNEFSGEAILSAMGKEVEKKIEFVIERMPTGQKEITVKILEGLDYPIAPVIKNLKEHIDQLDRDGKLP